MVNINKLKGKIVENGTNVETIARQMGMDKATLYRRFADEGKNFTIGEAQEISSILNLTRDEINDIFFAPSVT